MRNIYKQLAITLVICMCFGFFTQTNSYSMVTVASADEISDAKDTIKDLNNKYSELEKQQKDLQNKIDKAKNEKEKQLAIKEKTTQEITILKSQIAVLNEKITVMENEIAAKIEHINSLTKDIAESYDLFKQRMRALYMTDNTTKLGLILGADSYGDYLSGAETAKRVAAHDKSLIESLNKDKDEVEHAKAELDEAQLALESTKASAEAKNKELNNKLSVTNEEIQNLSDMEKEFLANKTTLQKQMKEVQAEIDDVYKQIEALEEDYVGGAFMYPVPGYRNITSYYGWRFGGTDYHTGVDFSGPSVYGKSVVASNSGVISYVQTTYVAGRGYGKYIIVDHGGGYSTLYGHLSAISVSKGARVAKGQKIGEVGSTGWSTGPHLHFEIRINGKHQNPLNFL